MSAEQDPASLKRQRAVVKGSCTRISTYVQGISVATPSVAAQLEERKIKLNEYWSQYNEIQSQLESIDENEINDRGTFEEAFFSLSAKIRELLNPVLALRAPPSSPSTSNASNRSEGPFNVRLPKLNLPSFSGKYDEWFPFFDSFKSVIHSNTSISNIQKLQYLKSSLSGDASNVIHSLEISELNYDVAWRLLRERYDNKRVIIHTHIEAIMELPSMTRENLIELRRIADGVNRHIRALNALKRPTSQWDDLLVYIVSSKLDATTLREWQASLDGMEPPTFKQLNDFIIHQCQMLEATSKASDVSSKDAHKRPQSNAKRQTSCVATVKAKCNFCKGEHAMYHCKDFLALPVSRRISEVRNRKICTNCLRFPSHALDQCTSGGCRVCKAKHNTLLHAGESTPKTHDSNGDNTDAPRTPNSSSIVSAHASTSHGEEYTMLSTALVNAFDRNGSTKPCRVLLDSGSQANFITMEYARIIGVPPRPLNTSISGINNTNSQATQAVKVRIQSRVNSYSITIDCVVTDQITGKLPTLSMQRSSYNIPRNLKLADPHFNVSAKVDLLIGAEFFWELLCVGQIKASTEHPTLQKTHFGWILAGRRDIVSSPPRNIHSFAATISNVQLHDQIKRFCEIEDITNVTSHNADEAYCEQHYLTNVSQNAQGRYVVKLPIKDAAMTKLGESRQIALKRLQGLERRLARSPQLRAQYSQFMAEYLTLGHMRRVDITANEDIRAFYLPHHCVFKTSEPSSKIRVVFDASCKSTTGVSLNDTLRVGPVVQQDLTSIVMRFRTFKFVLTADIIKMYRQVLVHPSQTPLQRILWRDDPAADVVTYELVTVTYGTTPASFLVTRSLKHLAEQHSAIYPVGASCVQRDFYVDDMLTGGNTLQEVETIRDETIQLLRLGCFELSKWASNNKELLTPVTSQVEESVVINKEANACILGVQWNPTSDTFHFSYEPDKAYDTVSKRVMLSEVSKLFDPLGLLGPTIVIAKLILQDLWRSNVDWDESVPQAVYTRWSTFKNQLIELNQLTIPRRVKFSANNRMIQVHGFCDASQYAYGACIYVRTKLKNGDYQCELLGSKSRVAPLKTISLPRLELSAALLLTRLLERVRASINLTNVKIYLWSDSTIALNWIASASRKFSVFVSNRIGEIQRATEPEDWRHVPSAQNPADLLSRGLNPRELVNATTWWKGPAFLQQSECQWPVNKLPRLGNDIPELQKIYVNVAIVDVSIINEILDKYSNLDKVCRIISYCIRFARRSSRATTLFITHEEMSSALHRLCKIVQQHSFPDDYKTLSNAEAISTSSKILSLTPFMDHSGLIRVGGRLRNSNLPHDTCHPILLPRDHELTKRIISKEHVRSMHAGTQATMAAVRQRFWPLSLRSTTRRIVLRCVRCFRVKPVLSEALMGSLPSSRVTISRPFARCGVDYAGPLILREGKRRNARNHKAYVAVFVCFTVKAVHLELVGDLTSDAFLAAFKRFISRRGRPSHVWSDNGTSFVGAKNQLKDFYGLLNDDTVQDKVKTFSRDQQISWSFIPPSSPHHGGLWEAAVKSAKYHMHRIIGKAHLTYEEMQTTLCEVEAILNSRPITALSADPNDLAYLTPGHFLIGTPMNSFPTPDLTDLSENRLVRWQRVEQLRQHFWRRWSLEYLHSLQTRSKWKATKGNQLQRGQLVLVKQQDLHPLNWLLGRVHEIHIGSDGIVRTADVKTTKGLLTRPLTKLAILPVETTDDSL
ncbi:uncharacterized protein LOC118648525 [Monomorium pharaonis]|uniref:uncharacterized protein LOC118648525 n=2 Tax=Monomorium pharaonis TaxID=307658 RepID=UPI001747C631|nr:uncharacterized protein LOC118648525 [Monomorium pharaonis]